MPSAYPRAQTPVARPSTEFFSNLLEPSCDVLGMAPYWCHAHVAGSCATSTRRGARITPSHRTGGRCAPLDPGENSPGRERRNARGC